MSANATQPASLHFRPESYWEDPDPLAAIHEQWVQKALGTLAQEDEADDEDD